MKKMNWKKLVLLVFFVLVSGTLFCCGQKNPAEEYFLQEEPEQEVTQTDAGQGTQEDKNQKTELLKAGNEESEKVTAYIHGCVKKPGVYSLPSGSRLYELIKKAGGFSKKAKKDAWNQAVLVEDGEQYKIPSKKAYRRSRKEQKTQELISAGMSAGENLPPAEAGKININSAGREELLTLSGIGESKADAILSYREEHGRFQSIEEIMNISGIKEGVFLRIQDKITTGE